ncbi:ABC transporter permease [Streptomyces sp. AcE210]|uniref:ABC transporter permease n=1 Tax=Streptomyces sp. AcE210 TaxID=2292703 RepID=UPI000E30AA07|nr:ABC transporter permease [Streptomyces sp. AcE210]RFC78118.1 ABC transporter permease [Streptomyces sp. AcE210]
MTAVRFRDLLASEWLRMWSLRSTPWVYLVTALAAIGFNAGEAYDTYHYWTEKNAGSSAEQYIRDGIPVQHAFTDNASLVFALAVTAIGVVSIAGEYSTGRLRTTFTAVPARRSVMLAKAAVLAGVTAVFGTVVALVSFHLTQAILGLRDVGVPIGHPGALRTVLASALLAPVCALVGMGIGTLLRHAGTSMAGGVLVLLIAPFFFSEDHHWSAVLHHALPMSAWRRLVEIPFTAEIPYPWTATGAWIVYVAWALGAVALSVTVVHRRDQ